MYLLAVLLHVMCVVLTLPDIAMSARPVQSQAGKDGCTVIQLETSAVSCALLKQSHEDMSHQSLKRSIQFVCLSDTQHSA